MRASLFGLLLLSALSSTCALPRPSARVAIDQEQGTATLFYLTVGAEKQLPSPLVEGTVAGTRTLIIVDTGAQLPVVAGWLARKCNLPVASVEAGHDPSGRSVAMMRCDHPGFGIDRLAHLPDRPAAVVDLPSDFEKYGIGAITSPQALAEPGSAIVLDLVNGRMERATLPDAVSAMSKLRDQSLVKGTRVLRHETSQLVTRCLVGNASIDGVLTTMELDTGAIRTMVVAESDAGRKLASRSHLVKEVGLSAVGAMTWSTASEVTLGVGDSTIRTAISVIPGQKDAECMYEGRIGMDYLRSCVLMIGSDTLRVSCKR